MYAAAERRDTSRERLTAHSIAEWTQQVGHLVDTRSEDHRRRQQEREPGGVLVIQPSQQPAHHCHARATDAGEQ